MAPTFSCANATCDNRTRDLRKGRWQKRTAVFPNAKAETEFTTHLCRECYKESLQARHEAESRRTTRTSPDAALQPVRPRTASVPELEQLAFCDGQSSGGEEEEEEVEGEEEEEEVEEVAEKEEEEEKEKEKEELLEMEFATESEEEMGIPMEVTSAEAENADEQVHGVSHEEAAETGDTLYEYIRRYEEQKGLRKPHRQRGAAFLREHYGAGPAALKCVRELLRRVWLLERTTKPFLDAALVLEQSGLPPLLSRFSEAIVARSVPADHAVWSELGDTFQNM